MLFRKICITVVVFRTYLSHFTHNCYRFNLQWIKVIISGDSFTSQQKKNLLQATYLQHWVSMLWSTVYTVETSQTFTWMLWMPQSASIYSNESNLYHYVILMCNKSFLPVLTYHVRVSWNKPDLWKHNQAANHIVI